jgi:hypothetical protein
MNFKSDCGWGQCASATIPVPFPTRIMCGFLGVTKSWRRAIYLMFGATATMIPDASNQGTFGADCESRMAMLKAVESR